MGNNPSRPNGGLASRPRRPQDRALTYPKQRTYSTRGKRSKYDPDFYDDDEDAQREFLAQHGGLPKMQMPHQSGHYVNPQYANANGQPLVFPQPQLQTGMNPVIPQGLHGAMPTANNFFPAPPTNMPMPMPMNTNMNPQMPMPEPVIPGMTAGPGMPQGQDAPVIPPLPRRRTGTPYHPPATVDPYDSDSSADLDRPDSETRERLQPRLLPGQYGPYDSMRDRNRAPAPALRRAGAGRERGNGYGNEGGHHRRTASSPAWVHATDSAFDEPPVIPANMTGGQFPGQNFMPQPEVGMGMGGMGMGMGPEPIRLTPYVPPPRSNNPLPPPPKNLLQSSPYARVLAELRRPIDDNVLLPKAPAIHTFGAVNVGPPHLNPNPMGSTRSSEKKKRKGLFRSFSSRISGRRREEDVTSPSTTSTFTGALPQLVGGQSTAVFPVVQNMPDGSIQLIYNNPGQPQAQAMVGGVGGPIGMMPGPGLPVDANPPPPVIPNMSAPGTGSTMPIPPGPAPTPIPVLRSPGPGGRSRTPTPQPQPQPPPPRIKIDRQSELSGLLHFSPHKIHYERKSYPTGMHLLEALKFLPARPDLAERIRGCGTPEEAWAVSEGLRDYWRRDWDKLFEGKLEEVLYHKFVQHPDLRALLLQTGIADIVFSDQDTMWGDGLIGQGRNWLGHALMRVRTRLREEGFD